MQRNSPLTAKARAFADAYAGPGSGTAAARAGGYRGSDHTCAVIASQLMDDERVCRRIQNRVGLEQWVVWFPPPAAVGEERWRAFADRYAGPGTEESAARDAGYDGNRAKLRKIGADLLNNPRVIVRICARVGDMLWEGWVLQMPPRPLEFDDDDELMAAIERELAATGPILTSDGEVL